jgi:hypothetical protein
MKNNGTFDISHSAYCSNSNRRRMKYRQVGTIQLLRGNRFVISLDEHKLPEGTRALYVKESITVSETDSATNSGDNRSDPTPDFDGW